MNAVREPAGGVELALEHGRQRLVVTEIGAGLQSWTVGGRELLDTTPGGRPDGRYTFDGTEHRAPLTEPARGNALHGLATERRWRAIRSSTRHLTLVHDLR